MTYRFRSALQIFVDRLNIRSGLLADERQALEQLQGKSSLHDAGALIVSPGELASHACMVVDGLVGRCEPLEGGERQITAFHVPGDMCDLHSLVLPRATWGLQALAPTAILRVPHDSLRMLMTAYPRVAEAFWRDCSVDATVLSVWASNLGRRDARSRLAHVLCELGVRMETAGLGRRDAYRLPATQMDLGDALGLTSVHVNRVLRTLKDMELVTMRSSEVRVADWDALTALARFDEGYLHLTNQRIGMPPEMIRT